MNAATARNSESTINSILFLAFELSLSIWKLGFTTSLGQKPREVNLRAGDLERLHREIAAAKKRFALPPSAQVLSCYEAGRDGFWLHRHLQSQGIDNVVVDPSSVSVKRKAKQAKTDRLDVEKLLRHLIRSQDDPKEWSRCRVPTVEQEDQRFLHREIVTLKGERTGHINRIKGLLVLHGIRREVRADFLKQLDNVRLWDSSPLPPQLRSYLEREYQRLQLVEEQIKTLEAQRRQALRESDEPLAEKARRLMLLRAIGDNSAWAFSSELFSWRTFNNRRELASLAGLTPTPHKSGDAGREKGLDKSGIRWVRSIAIEIAWGWLRYQPDSQLSRWYEQRFGAGSKRTRKIGIVALARKLLIALWHFVEHGVVPQGAVLKV